MGQIQRWAAAALAAAIMGMTWGAGIVRAAAGQAAAGQAAAGQAAAGQAAAGDVALPAELAGNRHAVRALAHLRGRAAELGARPGSDFVPLRARTRGARHYVKLGQTHRGVPVFAAQATVQLDDAGDVTFLLPDFSRSPDLDGLATTPKLPVDNVREVALRWAEERHARKGQARTGHAKAGHAGPGFETRPPMLEIFDPAVLGAEGTVRLVWDIEVGPSWPMSTGGPGLREPGAPDDAYRLLIDATDGTIVRSYPLALSGLDRKIYDSQDSNIPYRVLARDEGWPPTGIIDVDQSYQYVGDTYLFYLTRFNRDGIDNAGLLTRTDVRYCENTCPYYNAFWSTFEKTMFFGNGWAVDDVTAHEYTHGVTAFESNLIYENASGAMNESMSDIFGEFVDLTNGSGADDPSVRWFCGEELAFATLRNMANPPAYNQPDRLRSPLYFPPADNPSDLNDQGGVHTNSGVGNKLCFLLTDGGTFNGQTVTGMGISRIAALYYEANTNLLTSAAGWDQLYYALRQAAVNLGWTPTDRANLERACAAVEIAAFYVSMYACAAHTGQPACFGNEGPFQTVGSGLNALPVGGTLKVYAGTYPEAVLLNKRGFLEAKQGTARIGP